MKAIQGEVGGGGGGGGGEDEGWGRGIEATGDG